MDETNNYNGTRYLSYAEYQASQKLRHGTYNNNFNGGRMAMANHAPQNQQWGLEYEGDFAHDIEAYQSQLVDSHNMMNVSSWNHGGRAHEERQSEAISEEDQDEEEEDQMSEGQIEEFPEEDNRQNRDRLKTIRNLMGENEGEISEDEQSVETVEIDPKNAPYACEETGCDIGKDY